MNGRKQSDRKISEKRTKHWLFLKKTYSSKIHIDRFIFKSVIIEAITYHESSYYRG